MRAWPRSTASIRESMSPSSPWWRWSVTGERRGPSPPGRHQKKRPDDTQRDAAHSRKEKVHMEVKDRATRTSPFLSYDLEKRIHRSARDEWQPHQTQSDTRSSGGISPPWCTTRRARLTVCSAAFSVMQRSVTLSSCLHKW